MKNRYAILLLLFLSLNVNAQSENVDLERIKQKKLKKSLIETKLFLIENINKLSPTCPLIEDTMYSFHTYSIYFDAPIDSVWSVYTTANPNEIWQGKFTSFGFAYSRNEDELFYQGETFDKLEEGQIQFLSLRYLWGLFKLNIAHELIGIDEASKRLQFCYMKYGKSEGTQILTLTEENGKTKVTHNTYYKSGSKFRDKRIYPYFHEKTIEEMHVNVGEYLKERSAL